MHFEGEFRVPGTPSEVIRRFEDVPRMASCMPGAVLEPQAEDGSWPGKMVVAFGPKKVAFKGKVTCAFDEENHTGTLQGRGTADMRAARIGVKVAFALHPAPAATEPTTIVKIVSDAELGGVLADFARTGGVAVANVIMADFARRASEEFSRDAPVSDPGHQAPPVASVQAEPAAGSRGGEAGDARSAAARPTAGQVAPGSAYPTSAPAGQDRSGVVSSGPSSAGQPAETRVPPRPEPAALSAHGLLWAVIKAQFFTLARRFGFGARGA